MVVLGVLGAFCFCCSSRFTVHLKEIAACGPLQLQHLRSVAWHCLWSCPFLAHFEHVDTVSLH